jgi:hypothetical protein
MTRVGALVSTSLTLSWNVRADIQASSNGGLHTPWNWLRQVMPLAFTELQHPQLSIDARMSSYRSESVRRPPVEVRKYNIGQSNKEMKSNVLPKGPNKWSDTEFRHSVLIHS